MERAKSSIIAWLMLCGIVFGQEPASLLRQLDEMSSRIRHLEDKVQSMSDNIEKRQPVADKGTKQIPADSQATKWDPSFTAKSKSLEWFTNSLDMAEQINIYQFVTNGEYVSPAFDAWGYDGALVYSALVRYNPGAGGAPILKYAPIPDVKAAVDDAATPDYVGADGNTGFLRIGQVDATDGLSKTDGGNFVTLAHYNTSGVGPFDCDGLNVLDTMTFDTYGHVQDHAYRDITADVDGRITAKLPNGTANYQILYWYNSAWNLLNIADADYKVLQRKADDSLGYDYVRAHD